MNQATSYSCNEKPFNTCHSTPLYNPSPFIALFFTFHQIPCYNLMEESRNAQYSKGQQSSDELPRSHKVVKAATAATAGGSLLVLSSLTMAGTVIGLAVVTPLFVIFSPVLVPAAITVSLLIVGFLATGGFGVAAMVVLSWFFRYMAGKGRDVGGDLPEKGRYRFGGKGRSELEG